MYINFTGSMLWLELGWNEIMCTNFVLFFCFLQVIKIRSIGEKQSALEHSCGSVSQPTSVRTGR